MAAMPRFNAEPYVHHRGLWKSKKSEHNIVASYSQFLLSNLFSYTAIIFSPTTYHIIIYIIHRDIINLLCHRRRISVAKEMVARVAARERQSLKTKREVRREQLHNNYNVRRKNTKWVCAKSIIEQSYFERGRCMQSWAVLQKLLKEEGVAFECSWTNSIENSMKFGMMYILLIRLRAKNGLYH